MEKEFINYEQALALKELGFDEPCFTIYNTEQDLLYIKPRKLFGDIKTPLYQQAFRWFREKYELYPVVASYFGGAVFGIEDKDKNYHNNLKFKTHEEAELECLKKLIEIIKNK